MGYVWNVLVILLALFIFGSTNYKRQFNAFLALMIILSFQFEDAKILSSPFIWFVIILGFYSFKYKLPKKNLLLILFSAWVFYTIINTGTGYFYDWRFYVNLGLIPLMIFYIGYYFEIENVNNLEKFYKATVISIFFIIIFISIGNISESILAIGTFENRDLFGYGSKEISLGPVSLLYSHNIFASNISLIIPIIFMGILRSGRMKLLIKISLFSLLILSFYFILLSTSRGFLGASVAGCFVEFVLFVILIKKKKFLIYLSIIFISLIYFLPQIIEGLNIPNADRLLNIYGEGIGSDALGADVNFVVRINNLVESVDYASKNILRPRGFSYNLINNYDDPMFSSVLLNGSGIIGVILFFLLMIKLIIYFSSSLIKNRLNDSYLNYALIAIGTIATNTIGGFTTTSLISDIHYSIIFWGIIFFSYWKIYDRKVQIQA